MCSKLDQLSTVVPSPMNAIKYGQNDDGITTAIFIAAAAHDDTTKYDDYADSRYNDASETADVHSTNMMLQQQVCDTKSNPKTSAFCSKADGNRVEQVQHDLLGTRKSNICCSWANT